MYYTNHVIDFVSGLQYSKLPPEVVAKAKTCILDLMGVALAGARTKAGSIARQFTTEHFGSGTATIFGDLRKSNCAGAAWANCVAASALDLDDGHNLAVGHPGAVVIPAALALAESRGLSGKELILAIVAGYEVAVRIAGSRVPAYIHTYASGPWGVYGAAVAAAKLLGLGKEKIMHSVGIAGSHGPARPHSKEYEFVPMVKECIGWAGMTGLSAALLAEKGFTGFKDFLDYGEFFDGEELTHTLGQEYEILEVWFKPHSSCRWTHSSIDAILQLKQNHHLRPDEIIRINVRSFERASIMGQKAPITEETAQYSIPYCIAAALCEGKVGPDQVAEQNIREPRLLDVASKVEIAYDDGMHQYFPRKLAAIVDVVTTRGQFSCQVLSPKGDMENPLTGTELALKFDELAGRVLNAAAVKELRDCIMSLDCVTNVNDITQLIYANQFVI